jgi:TIR domain
VDFDVFLFHNSADKPAVEEIACKLKDAGFQPWLDKWCLTPGETFQRGLAEGLRNCATCVSQKYLRLVRCVEELLEHKETLRWRLSRLTRAATLS